MQPDTLALVSTSASPEELILRNFATTIGRKRYEQWFQNKTQVWIEGDELVVAVSTPFLVNWFSQSFRPTLIRAARPVIGDSASVRFEVRATNPASGTVSRLNESNVGLNESSIGELAVGTLRTPPDLSRSRSSNASSKNKVVRLDTNVEAIPPASMVPRHSILDGHADKHDRARSENTPASLRDGESRMVDRESPGLAANQESNGQESSGTISNGAVSNGAGRFATEQSVDERSHASLRLMCEETHVSRTPSQPVTLKYAVAAATNAVQSASSNVVTSSKSTRDAREGGASIATERKAQRQSTRQTDENSRPVNSRPNVDSPIAPRTPGTKSLPEKPTTDVPVASVARITKDSPLTLAKVKPVADLPRNQRRYADLLDLVEGTCNEFALSAARQVCQAPGVQFTSLFVHGPVGVGKTHILEGIHRELKQRFPTRQVVYLTAEAFANFFTQALRDQKLPSFRQKFRSIDVLIVDDIDFFDGKRGIQEEFLFTVQQLEAHGRVIVVAAHGHPRLLTKMSDELRTRFLAGMVCRIDAPEVATRRRIIENKAFRAGTEFAPEVVQFVADRFRNNVRELEGAFNTLLAHQRMRNRRLSLTAARNALSDLERDCIRVIRMVDIEQAVCTMFGITNDDLKSNKRQQSISQPRMLAMYLARKHTRAAYTEIGQHFGGRNHSTVMAAEKKIRASLTEETPLVIRTQTWRIGDLIETLEQQLQAS